MQKEGHAGLEVNSCGFHVSKTHGFLRGASPDGLVVDPSENPSGLVEAKNIQLHENESLMAALIRKGNVKTSRCHMTTSLWSRLQFAVRVSM